MNQGCSFLLTVGLAASAGILGFEAIMKVQTWITWATGILGVLVALLIGLLGHLVLGRGRVARQEARL